MQHQHLPIFPLGTVLFPGAILPLHIFEERYRRMLEASRNEDPAFAISLVEYGGDGDEEGMPSGIGTACSIAGISPRSDGRSDIVVTGAFRVKISDVDWSRGYAVADIALLDDVIHDQENVKVLYARMQYRFAQYLAALEMLVQEKLPKLQPSDDPAHGAWVIAETLTLHTWERQQVLEYATVDERLEEIHRLLRRELALLIHTGAIGSTIDFPGRRKSIN
ncbi:MAG: LON peptidase substrate-binding domain-containing protein [Thermomicrobiales bacterium]